MFMDAYENCHPIKSDMTLDGKVGYLHGEVTPCQIKNHVQRKFATPILYAIDIFKSYDFFSLYT